MVKGSSKRVIEKPRASGTMTEAMFTTFVKSALRNKSRFWKPISDVLKKSRVERGKYLCNGCGEIVPSSIVVNDKRVKNIVVDHNPPVIDPERGFTSWDDFINRLFCEEEFLQALCHECHNKKSQEERLLAKNSKKEVE